MADSFRVFGIGFPRTGMDNLVAALLRLGRRHVVYDLGSPDARKQAEVGDFQWLEGKADLVGGISWYYEAIDSRVAEAKFVLTVRPTPAWLTSIHWIMREEMADPKLLQALLLGRDFDADWSRRIYERHQVCVRRHFEGRPEKLLVLDVEKDGLDKLAEFLRIEAAARSFSK